MHLSIRLIFTLACQMTTGEMGGSGVWGRAAEWNQLIGSHQQGITKSTCHPLGSSNTMRGPSSVLLETTIQTNAVSFSNEFQGYVNYFCKVKVTLQFIDSECLQYFNSFECIINDTVQFFGNL